MTAREDAQTSPIKGLESKRPGRNLLRWKKSDKKCELTRAAEEGNEDLMHRLCNKGRLDPKQVGTALVAATLGGHVKCVEILCKRATGVNVFDAVGKNALHYTALCNAPEITEVLIRHGADTDLQDNGGMTALHYALEKKNFDVAKILILNGASLMLKNKSGHTAEHVAVQTNNADILNLLQQMKISAPRKTKKPKSTTVGQVTDDQAHSEYDYITPYDICSAMYQDECSAPTTAAAETSSPPAAISEIISKLSMNLLQMLEAKMSQAAMQHAKPEILPFNPDQLQNLQKLKTAIPSSKNKQPTSEQAKAVTSKSQHTTSSTQRMCQEVEKKPALPPPRVRSMIMESSTNVATSTHQPSSPYNEENVYIKPKEIKLAESLPLQQKNLYLPYCNLIEMANDLLDMSYSESDTAEIISQIFNSLTAETELETQASEITVSQTSPNLMYNNENVFQTTSFPSTSSEKCLKDEKPDIPAPRLPKRRRNTSSDSPEDPTTGVYNNENSFIQPHEVNHKSTSSMLLPQRQRSNAISEVSSLQIQNHPFPNSRQKPTAKETVDTLTSLNEHSPNSVENKTDATLLSHEHLSESVDYHQSATEQQKMQPGIPRAIRNSWNLRSDKSEPTSHGSTLPKSSCSVQRSSEPITRPVPLPRQKKRVTSEPVNIDEVVLALSRILPISSNDVHQLQDHFKKRGFGTVLEQTNPHHIDSSHCDQIGQEQNSDQYITIYVQEPKLVNINSQVDIRHNKVDDDDNDRSSNIDKDIYEEY